MSERREKTTGKIKWVPIGYKGPGIADEDFLKMCEKSDRAHQEWLQKIAADVRDLQDRLNGYPVR